MPSANGGSVSAGPVARCYWSFTVVLVIGIVLYSSSQDTGAGLGIITLLLALPLVQLAASLLTLFCAAVWRAKFPDEAASLRQLGKITLYSFLGALVGVLATLVGLKLLG